MDEYLGIVKLFAGTYAPRGWAFCDGRLIAISQNSALFSLLGTQYGGDGIQTFGLPDLRGRVAVGAGQGPGLSNYVAGEITGTETVALTTSQMPAHTHGTAVLADFGTNASPVNAVPAITVASTDGGETVNVRGYGPTPNATGGNVLPAGGSQPFSVLQPLLGMNYIICLEGVYPSRD